MKGLAPTAIKDGKKRIITTDFFELDDKVR